MGAKGILAKYWQLGLLVLLGLALCWPLFVPGYFSHHDDLQIIRIFEMRRCLGDFQIPCRWVPDMGYGNGFPLFNFYGPLPYYLGALLSFLAGYLISAKALFFLGVFFGGVGMFLFAKEFMDKNSALVAGVLFLFAPYRALDAYVRGAVSELLAISMVPFLFYFFYKLMVGPRKKYFIASAVTLAAFLITHNIMTILFVPVLVLWLGLLIYLREDKGLRSTLLAGLLGFGLAAFFTLPAFFEKSLVQTEALTRFELNFRAHYVTVRQLFLDRFWGYGASVLGPNDTISFQIGWPLWWMVALVPIVVFLRKLGKKTRTLMIFFFLLFGFSVFMTHNKSTFIWERIDILKYFQFPWRFLSLTVFSASILGGFAVSVLKKPWRFLAVGMIILITIGLNWSFFKPGQFYLGLTDKDFLSGPKWEEQQKGAILDYLPKTAAEPKEKAPTVPLVLRGTGEVESFVNKSNSWMFSANLETQSYIEVPVFYFPDWKVTVDGQDAEINYQNSLGRIGIHLPSGEHEVRGMFDNTPTRIASNWLTLLSFGGLALAIIYGKTWKIFN